MKKKGFLVVGGAAVIVGAVFFGTHGFGLGTGKGPGTGETQSVNREVAEKDVPKAEEAEIPNNVIVSIVENEVSINGEKIADYDALHDWVEEYNRDSRTFELHEERSILETYEWVKKVFDDLGVTLIEK